MKNRETFTEVYKRYSALIMKSVMAQTENMELAEEICQNVFLAYYRHMDKVEPEFVKAWLLHVTDNQIIDYQRKLGRRMKILHEKSTEEFMGAEAPVDVVKQYTDRRFICEIMEKLKEKNPRWYEIIDCVCIKQMSLEEAEKYLGVPKEDLKSRLYRARKFIREMFEEER